MRVDEEGLKIQKVYSRLSLCMLEEALKKVEPSYTKSYQYEDYEGNEFTYEQLERNFAYELYHQIRTLKEKNLKKENKIVINAEVVKQGYVEKKMDSTEKSIKKTHVLPDIVIHGGQGESNKNLQLLVAEIKRNSTTNQDLKRDLQKLGWYLTSLTYADQRIPFGVGCFIMTNISKDQLYKKIKTVLVNEPDCDIHFIGENNRDEKLSEVADKITIFSYKENENNSHENKANPPTVEKFLLSNIFDDLQKAKSRINTLST